METHITGEKDEGLKCLKPKGLKILKYWKTNLKKHTYYLIVLLLYQGFLIFNYLTISITLKLSKYLFTF